MIRKPAFTFRHYVSKVFTVHGCPEKRAEEARGLFGCHPFGCPHCRRTFMGWELWGENGHLQATARTRDQLIAILTRKAREVRRASGRDPSYQPAGATIGNSFSIRSAIFYKG